MDYIPDTLSKDFRLFDHLQARRVNWEWLWQRIADYVIPARADFVITRYPGQRRDYEIFDTTATWALDQLSAGLHTLLTSQALPWFYLMMRDDALAGRQDVQIWMSDTQSRINQIFNDPHSKFQAQIHETYLDLGAFGTAVMDVQYDKGVKFCTRYLGECYLAQTHYGTIDTLFRSFVLPIHRVIDIFGEENIPPKMLETKDPFAPQSLLHAVQPNDKGSGYSSRYYATVYKTCLKEGTFKTFPYITPRWARSHIEDYGRGPAINSLADILMVNEMKRTLLRSAHKAVDPPLMVPDGGYMQSINLQPGATNYYDTTVPGKIDFLETKANFPIGEKLLEMTQQDIIRAFYVDMLQLPGGLMPGAKNQNTYMTATEATIRRENAMRVIGPIVSRLQTELLGPLVEKVYEILVKQRSLSPAPEHAVGANIDIGYMSPLSIAQSGAEVDNFTRFFTQIQPLAAINPTVLDSIDTAQIAPWLAGKYHVAPRIIRSQDEVKKIQDQRAQQQQQQSDQIQANTNLTAAKRNTEYSKQMETMAGTNQAT